MKYDLVILDLILTDGNAQELIPFISEYNLPIIVYSSIELDHNFAQYVQHSLLKSRITLEKLLALIERVLIEPNK